MRTFALLTLERKTRVRHGVRCCAVSLFFQCGRQDCPMSDGKCRSRTAGRRSWPRTERGKVRRQQSMPFDVIEDALLLSSICVFRCASTKLASRWLPYSKPDALTSAATTANVTIWASAIANSVLRRRTAITRDPAAARTADLRPILMVHLCSR